MCPACYRLDHQGWPIDSSPSAPIQHPSNELRQQTTSQLGSSLLSITGIVQIISQTGTSTISTYSTTTQLSPEGFAPTHQQYLDSILQASIDSFKLDHPAVGSTFSQSTMEGSPAPSTCLTDHVAFSIDDLPSTQSVSDITEPDRDIWERMENDALLGQEAISSSAALEGSGAQPAEPPQISASQIPDIPETVMFLHDTCSVPVQPSSEEAVEKYLKQNHGSDLNRPEIAKPTSDKPGIYATSLMIPGETQNSEGSSSSPIWPQHTPNAPGQHSEPESCHEAKDREATDGPKSVTGSDMQIVGNCTSEDVGFPGQLTDIYEHGESTTQLPDDSIDTATMSLHATDFGNAADMEDDSKDSNSPVQGLKDESEDELVPVRQLLQYMWPKTNKIEKDKAGSSPQDPIDLTESTKAAPRRSKRKAPGPTGSRKKTKGSLSLQPQGQTTNGGR